uniref:Centromere protein I n=1 Tax=Heliothis virescens TaxID=7102 RepID=A0A2A4JBP3_HELVI
MADVDEIIDYIKSLKKGFDKDLFQNKIDELAYAVDTSGLQYNDFHTLFKVWLNLSIPITKWVSLGACVVPPDSVEDRTVEYALSWILSNYEDQSSFSRIGFLLDWLTAAMECECIDMETLEIGYDVFYVSLSYEALSPHAMKLVYTLTKPIDVTRRRVLELLDYARKRETKKSMYRQLQVLLGLFKSYKPECVPEDVPAISIHTAFKKINLNLLARFKRNQEHRNTMRKEKHHLTWINPINSERGRNKKTDPLVPNMEFFSIGSKQYADKEPQKNFLDFTDPVSVLQCSVQSSTSRPARLRALLCNATGVALLAVASHAEQAFLSHDLHHLLNSCFLNISPHTYIEKQDLLHRLAILQHTLMQGIPVITRFLAQYLPLWNEKDYFAESPHAMKLVYTLTKPIDVTRRRVLELLDYARKRETKKSMYRQLQVLLGLFKSYKPECVPEDVPAISIHTAFKKINLNLLARFKRNQEHRNTMRKEKHHLTWINPINSERGRNKKTDPLVPNMEFFSIGSKQYADKEPQKNFLDFTDPVSVLQCSVQSSTSRPARLRALLCNATGVALLAVASHAEQAFLSHDLHHLLNSCFLNISPHTYIEKQDLLHRLAILQHTLMQGIPVITRFLAQYLPLWNEKDYFAEILELVQWVSLDSPDQVMCVVEPLTRMYHRAQPVEQCAILKSLNNMYSNLVYCSTRTRLHFMGTTPSPQSYNLVLPKVATAISDMCNKELQVNPDDMLVLHSAVHSGVWRARSSAAAAASAHALAPPLALALPLLSCSAALLDSVAGLMILYKKIFTITKKSNTLTNNGEFENQMQVLQAYTSDLINCLYSEEVLSARNLGFVFNKLHPQLVSKLGSLMPDVDSKLSIRNSIAFAPYTYIQLDAIDHRDADNKLWFNAVIEQEFTNLSRFLKKAVTELRYQ